MLLALEPGIATSRGRPPPFSLTECAHRDRTVYVTLGSHGRYLIRLCERGHPGWHGHGEIIGERCTEDGITALTLVCELASASEPDAMILGHER